VVELRVDALARGVRKRLQRGEWRLRREAVGDLHLVVVPVMARRLTKQMRVFLVAEVRQAVKVRRLKREPIRHTLAHQP
jgi:hypothetical protein